jgi:IrrE N-terminal-like domain
MNAISVEKDRISTPAAYRRTEMEPGRDAWDLVKQVWMTEGPGRIILPVDPVAISRRLGIEVYSDDELPPDVSGIVRKDADLKNPEIFVNEADPDGRQRFTCAHALGHYSRCAEVGRNGIWEFVERRDFFAVEIREIEEVYATEFATEMLMPRAVLREIAGTPGVASLAAMFGVTDDIMRFRLDQIGRRG